MVDIYISRINNPGDIVATYQTGTLIKEEINFIMLPTEIEGTSKERHFANRQSLPIFLSIPSFEIHGQIQWGTKTIEANRLLATDAQNFLPILSATASNSLFPGRFRFMALWLWLTKLKYKLFVQTLLLRNYPGITLQV